MRSVLIKSSMIMAAILAMGSGLSLAAASSEPGMFLYPIKRITQPESGAFGTAEATQLPTFAVQDAAGQAPAGPDNPPTEDSRGGAPQEVSPSPSPALDQASASPTRTSARSVDQVTATMTPGSAPGSGLDVMTDNQSTPASDQPETNLGIGQLSSGRNDDPSGANPDNSLHQDSPDKREPDSSHNDDQSHESPDHD